MVNRRTNFESLRSLPALMALAISSAGVGAMASQAAGTPDPEPTFPSLLPQPPLWATTEARSRKPEARSDNRLVTTDGIRFPIDSPPWEGQDSYGPPQADSTHDQDLTFPGLLPRSPLPQTARPRGRKREAGTRGEPGTTNNEEATSRHSPIDQETYNGSGTAGEGPALAIPSTVIWGRALEALGLQEDAELRFPSFSLGSPFSSSRLTTQGENGRWEEGEIAASPLTTPAKTPVARPTDREPLAQSDNGQLTTDRGPSPNSNPQSKIDNYEGPPTTDHLITAAAYSEPADRSFATSVSRRPLRDPFKLPPPPRAPLAESDPKLVRTLPPGLRGLLIAQLKLKGVVRDSVSHTMMAVVTNSSNRAYFLHEGEAVYDGVVSKITPDAVYFKENFFDAKREARTREVVKLLNSAAGEAR